MTKEKYHHGTLREDLIEKGLQLLNKEGYDNLSLRKVASMCGVSHTAPYKHFKNKDELISGIIAEVTGSFHAYLLEIKNKFTDNPELQIFEIGKGYVQFFVEHPDYLKFMFLTDHGYAIQAQNSSKGNPGNDSFNIFRESALNYLNYIKAKPEDYFLNILTMWSIVHGITALMVNKCIRVPGDYMTLVDRMLKEKLKLI